MFTRDAQAVGRWVLAQQGCPIEPPPGFHALGSMADGQLVSGAIWYPAGDGSAWMHAAFGTPTPSFVCELVDALFVCDALTAVRFDLPPDHDMLKRVVMRLGARPCSAPSEQGYVSYELGKKDIEPWLRLHL